MATVAETMREITRDHLITWRGLAAGQCLTAVGWVGGTVPELSTEEGIVELPMSDVAGGYLVTGMALAGRRPIYIIRYQGFAWFNLISVLNYAAKSKEMWETPCPMFVRMIGMDGAIGPTASGSHHSIATRMPGVRVAAPMTPGEYRTVWEWFMAHDDPVIVSESRKSFNIENEIRDVISENADVTLFPISSTRLNIPEAVQTLAYDGIRCNVCNVLWLKPFSIGEAALEALANSRAGLVIDGDYENGVVKCIAYDLMHNAGKPVYALGLDERTAGFAPSMDNLPPSAQKICATVREILAKC